MIKQFTHLDRTITIIEHEEEGKPKYRAIVNGLLYFAADTPEDASERATQYLDKTAERETSARLTKPYTALRP